MGKPRLIILVRHAQSEGNKNRSIHQVIPDHRVKLTDEGWKQAEEAGRRLRRLLKPDDTLQIFTSPYRRTRETTEGILKSLTARHDADDPDASPSPFSRSKIKVYEEPRLREQDFGNFQPCSDEMDRMWRERADYGHFFYRIPNGESAADAYDRVSGFNESLWRQFGDDDFPSVCVLVTHGLMTRVFLMKWYHWSVEYFEDLRNINHCEFILMTRSTANGKYKLESDLRTWSELRRQKAQEALQQNPARRNTLSSFLASPIESPALPPRQWGGCVSGCNHKNEQCARRQQQASPIADIGLPPAAQPSQSLPRNNEDHVGEAVNASSALSPSSASKAIYATPMRPTTPPLSAVPGHLHVQSSSFHRGDATPHEMSEDEGAYFAVQRVKGVENKKSRAAALTPTSEEFARWSHESGMGRGRHADALGDEPDPSHGGNAVAKNSNNESDVAKSSHEASRAEQYERSVQGNIY